MEAMSFVLLTKLNTKRIFFNQSKRHRSSLFEKSGKNILLVSFRSLKISAKILYSQNTDFVF